MRRRYHFRAPLKQTTQKTHTQDIEYKIAGSVKQFQGATGSVIAPHGAIAMWDREAFEEILYKTHDTIFYAEDMKCGTGAAQLGYHLAVRLKNTAHAHARKLQQTQTPDMYAVRGASGPMACLSPCTHCSANAPT